MDSCQIFNILFGPRRATTELARCFSSLRREAMNRRRAKDDSDLLDSGQTGTGGSTSTPSSPLKQLQRRIVNLTRSSDIRANKKCCQQNRQQQINGTTQTAKITTKSPINLSADLSEALEEENESVLGIQSTCQRERVSRATDIHDGCLSSADNDHPSSKLSDESHENHEVRLVGHEQPDSTQDEVLQVTAELGRSCSSVDCRTYRATLVQLAAGEPVGTKQQQDDTILEKKDDPSSIDTSKELVIGNESSCSTRSRAHPAKSTNKTKRIVLYADELESPEAVEQRSPALVGKLIASGEACSMPVAENASGSPMTATTSPPMGGAYVRSLVQSIELQLSTSPVHSATGERRFSSPLASPIVKQNPKELIGLAGRSGSFAGDRKSDKPITIVKPLPPKTARKTSRAKCLNYQLSLAKPVSMEALFLDERFLARLFEQLSPIDRCSAAQVCKRWRQVLYANESYWRGLITVIDCMRLRRERSLECIISALQTARQNRLLQQQRQQSSQEEAGHLVASSTANSIELLVDESDKGELWRIQELCNRYVMRQASQKQTAALAQQAAQVESQPPSGQHVQCYLQQQHDGSNQTNGLTSKSSSIQSQISSTYSSASLSSILGSSMSESSRIESMRDKLYHSIDYRGFDAICLCGATDDDILDLVSRIPERAYSRLLVGRLFGCALTDAGLAMFLSAFTQLQELEISNCSNISMTMPLQRLEHLKRLRLKDCVSLTDSFADQLGPIFNKLEQLIVQSYHLSDNFLKNLNPNQDQKVKFKSFGMSNCKNITDETLEQIALKFVHLEHITLAGSTYFSDTGIEFLLRSMNQLQTLDLSWCGQLTNTSLQAIGTYLANSLAELILDRNNNYTDEGINALLPMRRLNLLYINFCSGISDRGIATLATIRTLKYLSCAGLFRVSSQGWRQLAAINDLLDLELSNCPNVDEKLVASMAKDMPKCNIVY